MPRAWHGDEPLTERFEMKFTKTQMTALQQQSKASGVPVAEIVRRTVTKAVVEPRDITPTPGTPLPTQAEVDAEVAQLDAQQLNERKAARKVRAATAKSRRAA